MVSLLHRNETQVQGVQNETTQDNVHPVSHLYELCYRLWDWYPLNRLGARCGTVAATFYTVSHFYAHFKDWIK